MTQDIKRIVQNQDFLTVLQQSRGVLVTAFGASNNRKDLEIARRYKSRNRAGCFQPDADCYCLGWQIWCHHMCYIWCNGVTTPETLYIVPKKSADRCKKSQVMALYHSPSLEAIRFAPDRASRPVEFAFNRRENQRDGHNSFSADESADKIEIRHLTPESKSPRQTFSQKRGPWWVLFDYV